MEAAVTAGSRSGGTQRLPGRAVVEGKRVLTRARSRSWALKGRPDSRQNGIRILLYHRIGSRRDQLGVTPAQFADQMNYLASAGFRAVGVRDALDVLYGHAHREPGRRLVGLSFDDGYRDVVEHGSDVLQAHGFRATIFVVVHAADGRLTFPWDAGGRQPHPVLTWREIAELDNRSPFSFEAHSMTHPVLTQVTTPIAREQIHQSKSTLEDRLSRRVEVFAYPGGWFGPRERDLVAEAGYSGACTCEPGINTGTTNPFELRRIAVSATDSFLDFRAKVHGAHDAALPLRGAYRRIMLGGPRPPASNAARGRGRIDIGVSRFAAATGRRITTRGNAAASAARNQIGG
jgi:peptidoglycan/xylan/chitin deacetylase (PgdA/CDA1 family)